MKKGDYVRFKNGYIDRVEEIKLQTKYTKYNTLLLEHKVAECLLIDEELKKIKSSPNIMNLIELGDYVNGHKVVSIGFDNNNNIIELYVETQGYDELLLEKDIKSIVSEEQFSQMEYRIESEVN